MYIRAKLDENMESTVDTIQRCLVYALSPLGVRFSVTWGPSGPWTAAEKGEAEASTGKRRFSPATYVSVRGHPIPQSHFQSPSGGLKEGHVSGPVMGRGWAEAQLG